jgi:glycine hydroxymethyltransferase
MREAGFRVQTRWTCATGFQSHDGRHKNVRIECCFSREPLRIVIVRFRNSRQPAFQLQDTGPGMFDQSFRIRGFDDELADAIAAERVRQEEHVELIASENYASPRVLEAQGSVLTNKYAEGYPGKRYYGGCEFVDLAERLAQDRAMELFGATYANVQPHSGSQANSAAYHALLDPGDTILGMSLNEGGHLTHGSPVNFSGKLFNAVQYGINTDTGLLDYDVIEALAQEHRPKMLIGGFSAYSRQIDWARMREIADGVGAWFLVDMAHVAGLVAAGLYPNPLPHAHVVTSTTHKTLRGPRGGIILSNADEEMRKALNSVVFPGTQGGPLMHVIAAKAVAFKEALEPGFKAYQGAVIDNARAMAAVFMKRGYRIVSGGTDNHLFLVDLTGKEFTGKDAEEALGRAFITVNKNTVPGEPRSPFVTSGLRLGTPAVTTRGFTIADCQELASAICDILDDIGNSEVEQQAKATALKLCREHPVYA